MICAEGYVGQLPNGIGPIVAVNSFEQCSPFCPQTTTYHTFQMELDVSVVMGDGACEGGVGRRGTACLSDGSILVDGGHHGEMMRESHHHTYPVTP